MNINKRILLLPKAAYPYQYMNDWKKFNETLTKKDDFYSHLSMHCVKSVQIRSFF